ncbi:MAG: hypothetical protein ACLUFV_02150 [Acutalibacteraceae bacterium]
MYENKKLGRGAKISLPLLFLMLAALLVAALSGVFGAPGGASAGEASSEAAVSEALPADGDPEGVLILWAIDVGQGDGLLLRMPTGEHARRQRRQHRQKRRARFPARKGRGGD